MDLCSRASETIRERLSWSPATRDQAGIARSLADGEDISEVYGLGDATLFDLLFYFLDHLGVSKLFGALEPKRTKRKTNVNFQAVLLIYIMRITAGLAFFWHIGPVLLCSMSLMRLVGFNAREVREGTCARGPKRSAEASERIRGPYCPESIADSIASIPGSALERFFNAVIQLLASHRFFAKRVHALLDATDIESTERCAGCGTVRREKAPSLRARKGRLRKVWETVFGFKLWVVWDPHSKLPLALRFQRIEVADIDMAQEVVAQAIANLGTHAKIASLACDKGFLDGRFLWWLNGQGIVFSVPAKIDMHVYADALSLVDTGVVQTRERERSVGHGKNRSTLTDRWKVVGLSELTSAGFYGELGSGSHENRKDFVPNPLNAVVVLHDPYKANNPDSQTLLILTNGPVKKPLSSYDRYDARSEIENGLFREAKQGWFIKRPPCNTLEGYRAHVYLTLIVMALTTAFRMWMEEQETLSFQGKETGIRKFRQMIRQENLDRLIIFHEDRYAVFEAYEFAILLGRRVLKPRGIPETITPEDILRKHGALLE